MTRIGLMLLVVLMFVPLFFASMPAQARRRSSRGQAAQVGNQTVASFSRAKRLLNATVYAQHRKTFYCGCSYSRNNNVNHASCGYRVRSDATRARRMEWEHVVPSQVFGGNMKVWRKGHSSCINRRGRRYKGRRCAQKASPTFRRMEGDMYNLYPSIGEVNGRRSNYMMAEIPGERREFGRCDVEIADRMVEPPPAVRGDIARTYLYMDAAYPDRDILTRADREFYLEWAEADPVDDWECERAERIAEIQGNINPFVHNACLER